MSSNLHASRKPFKRKFKTDELIVIDIGRLVDNGVLSILNSWLLEAKDTDLGVPFLVSVLEVREYVLFHPHLI